MHGDRSSRSTDRPLEAASRDGATRDGAARDPFGDPRVDPFGEPRTDGDVARRFLDAAGTLWTVRERPMPADLGAQRCLVFESRNAVRRVRRYPPGWRTLDDHALETLSWDR